MLNDLIVQIVSGLVVYTIISVYENIRRKKR